jgi:hypothetical protein
MEIELLHLPGYRLVLLSEDVECHSITVEEITFADLYVWFIKGIEAIFPFIRCIWQPQPHGFGIHSRENTMNVERKQKFKFLFIKLFIFLSVLNLNFHDDLPTFSHDLHIPDSS